MIFVRSTDGIAIDRRSRRPSVELGPDGNVHLTVSSDETILNANNWYIADETPVRPADDASNTYAAEIVNTAPGVFERQWLHNAADHAQRIAGEARELTKTQLRNRVATFEAGTGTSAQVQQALADLIRTVHGAP